MPGLYPRDSAHQQYIGTGPAQSGDPEQDTTEDSHCREHENVWHVHDVFYDLTEAGARRNGQVARDAGGDLTSYNCLRPHQHDRGIDVHKGKF